MTDKETTTVQKNGVGFLGWLTLIFIVLKLNPGSHLDSPVEDWSWWWVLSPILIPFAILVVVGFVFGTIILVDKANQQRRRKQFQQMIAERRNNNNLR